MTQAFLSQTSNNVPPCSPLLSASQCMERPKLAISNPLKSAKEFLKRCQVDGHSTLWHFDGSWWFWASTHYHQIEDALVRKAIYQFLEQAKTVDADGNESSFRPDKTKVDKVMDALRAEALIARGLHMPFWLGTHDGSQWPHNETIACQNGIVNLSSGAIVDHTPLYFNSTALSVIYDACAAPPSRWFEFLHSQWAPGSAEILTLQQMMGLLLTRETRFQKIFILLGPRRSGKGTFVRILKVLLGERNVVGLMLSDLNTEFGISNLIDKGLSVIGDARFDGRKDHIQLIERLLSISGEDSIPVNRKNKEIWYGVLPTRLLIVTNEYPKIKDSSGVLRSRFVIVSTNNSFYGREDLYLAEALAQELSGIFLWAMNGWQSLKEARKFSAPAISGNLAAKIAVGANPVKAFVEQCCDLGPQYHVTCGELALGWSEWCAFDVTVDSAAFGRNFKSEFPDISMSQPTINGRRTRVYVGIRLKPSFAADLET